MFNHHFIVANCVRQAMRGALEGSGPAGNTRDTQETLLAVIAPRRMGWLEFVLRWWAARSPAARTEAKC